MNEKALRKKPVFFGQFLGKKSIFLGQFLGKKVDLLGPISRQKVDLLGPISSSRPSNRFMGLKCEINIESGRIRGAANASACVVE